jgi:DNA-binding beta-propeller fold protein YncE
LTLAAACEPPPEEPPPPAVARPRQSQSLALSADGALLAVVNPDADSLSIVDPLRRSLVREIALAPRPQPAADGRYEPSCGPRSVDLSADGKLAYVACQLSGQLLTVATDTGDLRGKLPIGAEPVAVLLHPSGRAVYVSALQSGEVVRLPLDAAGLPDGAAAMRQRTTDRPWALALDAGGKTLYATRFLLSPGLDRLDPETLALKGRAALPDAPSRGNRLLAHGEARGLYTAAVRPRPPGASGAGEVWAAHLLLASDVPQPDLDFESTVFPAVSVFAEGSDEPPRALLSVDSRLPGVDGQFADIVSGPRSLAFVPDGSLALVVNQASEDVLVIDAERRVQAGLLRPLPGDLPEGIVVSPDGLFAYVDERASGDIAVLAIAPSADASMLSPRVRVDGQPIRRFAAEDPMPAELRLGQRLFYSANSAKFAFTKNFWVACSSCHLEGRSDAVTWLFLQGPRDTPTNAGGTRGTGFLLRNAGRNALFQYDETIRLEQGGDIDANRPADRALLDALAAYVDRAVPFARSPEIDVKTGQPSAAAVRGKAVFNSLGCATCHSGARYTDSGSGNGNLDLSGPVVLHDVGTCAGAPFPDRSVTAVNGATRPACSFDTPSLNGVFDTPPYFHDGSAKTLEDVVSRKVKFLKLTPPTPAELSDLVAFLRSL